MTNFNISLLIGMMSSQNIGKYNYFFFYFYPFLHLTTTRVFNERLPQSKTPPTPTTRRTSYNIITD